MKLRSWVVAVAIATAPPVAGSCDDAAGPPSGIGSDACRLAVVQSDYVSSSVSLLTDEGALCASNVIHSGSRPPGVVTALSGDVVVPTEPHPDGLVVLVDRFANSTVTLLSPRGDEVLRQIPVATGFNANPQDFLVVGDDRAYVPRQERNATPTPAPDDLDEGGDVLIVSPTTGALLGRIDLVAQADEVDGVRLDPRPGRLARVGSRVVVGLSHLTEAAGTGGRGLIVAIDPATDAVTERLVVEGAKNCGTGIAATADAGGVWVVCSGVFPEGEAAQLAGSALVYVDGAGGEPTIGWIGRAEALGGRPFGFAVAATARAEVAYVVASGAVGAAADRVLRVDRAAGVAEVVDIDAGAFSIGDLFWGKGRTILLVANADPRAPGLWRFDVDADARATPRDVIDTAPRIGLPPRDGGAFR